MGPAFCPSCGAARVASLRFCAACGYDLSSPEVEAAGNARSGPLDVSHATPGSSADAGVGAVDCPNGRHPNFVRKVSAVFSEGYAAGVGMTSSGGGAIGLAGGQVAVGVGGGGSQTYGTSMTALSAKLAPPDEPVYRSPFGIGSWIVIAFFTFGGLVYGSAPATAPGNHAGDSLFGFLVAGGVIAWRLWQASGRHTRVNALHPVWEAQMARWNAAYYCSKCDEVFVPDEGVAVPATQLGTLLAPA